jgi:transcription initiation factor TFIIIB Brf1 subunit/transcription initiation factor TFIIB
VIEYDHAAGNGFCVACGIVVEENTIVNEIAFGEAANGAAIIQESFVTQGASTFVFSHPSSRNLLRSHLQLTLEYEDLMDTGVVMTHGNKP